MSKTGAGHWPTTAASAAASATTCGLRSLSGSVEVFQGGLFDGLLRVRKNHNRRHHNTAARAAVLVTCTATVTASQR